MEVSPEAAADEVTRLRGCLNDLIAIMALPALWSGGDPSHIAGALLEGLLGMLRLTFVFVRLNHPEGGAAVDMLRAAEPCDQGWSARHVSESLDLSLGDNPLEWPSHAHISIGDLGLSIASARLGLHGEIGVVVAASETRDFPAQTERLLLDVATNQAAIGLQQARLLSEQRRLAAELDDRVARRTSQLAAANDERRRETVERKRIEQALHASELTLRQGALTASIAHEVNQPLSGIITNASTCLRMLAADPPDLDGARETARRTIRDGNRAADVIARLRALFGKKDFTPEALDLNEAAQEVILLSLSELQKNRVVLHAELADGLPPLVGDRVQLQQVILNLVRNASDAMAAVHDRPRQLTIRTGQEGADRVRLTVRDAGVGIDAQSMEKLFDAFYTTKSTGMGIGLSVSRSIVERHHGRLWVERNDGPGATFGFSIPLDPARADLHAEGAV